LEGIVKNNLGVEKYRLKGGWNKEIILVDK